MTTHVHIVYAHPIGEDTEVFWMAVGHTREEAIARLTDKVREGWYASEAEIEADDSLSPEEAASIRAEKAAIDLEDATQWVLLVEGDFL